MDRTLTLQASGQVMAMALKPKAESCLQEREACRNVISSSGFFCCGQKDGQPSLGLSVSQYSGGVHELQVWKLQFRSCRNSSSDGTYVRRRATRKALAFCSAFNEVEQSSPTVPPGPTSPDGLKNQLEALQVEALQVRNRHNNARARFMRLTEVAHQLRRRASIDLNLGNEDAARKALVEKLKVIQAAELSKRRAQILEELSTKLGEAISAKETQYIVALSTPQHEEPTVITVAPRGEGSSSVNQDLDRERSPSRLKTAEASQICHEGTASVDFPAATAEDMNGDSRQVVPVSGDVLLETEKVSLAAELGYSTDRHIDANDEDVEAAVPVHESYNMKLPLEREDDDFQDGSEEVGTACHDGIGHFESIEAREASGKACFNDGRRRLFKGLILDVDHLVTAIELRLKTEVSRNMDSNVTELQLVGDLLEQVQSLRARISEVVVSLAQNET